MRRWHLVVLALAVIVYVLLRPPSVVKIARGMEVGLESGTIAYRGAVYTGEWGEPLTRAGTVRLSERAWRKWMPIVTADLALASGDFSDPELVAIESLGGGNMVWRAREQPEGTLVVLHIVPANPAVAKAVSRLAEGESVELAGREELRGSIESSTGAWVRLGHSNHRFFLVTEVRAP
jgi:hypothetical protein